MKFGRHFELRRTATGLLLVFFALSLGISASAQTGQSKQFPGIGIKNFGQMDERFYRGAQPKEADFKSLAALGIKTVIDLRDDPTSYEKRTVEALGLRYVNIPMSDTKYPGGDQ